MPPITFVLPSGAEIDVETSHPPIATPGVVEASPLDKVTGQDWGGAMERVAELANEAVAKLRDKIQPCKEVAVEFGVAIGGKTGVILVEGTVNANLKVTLKW
jgi:hypothetical protein